MTGKLRRALAAMVVIAATGPAVARAQQPVTITGRVVSDAGQPLPNATVALVGFSLGALTQDDGRYTFTVPGARVTGQSATLEARRLGFRPVRVSVTLTSGSTVNQDFTLVTNPLQLGEIVVTGAGTATAAERIGTVRTPVDSGVIQRSNETNVVSALAAKAPGVVVTSQSGSPGASASIRIRGLNTIQGTGQPLFVVDGQPIDNSTFATGDPTQSTDVPNRAADVNPNDIESIEILKSSAAAAIYGARAGQGVVLITTKRGGAGGTRYSLRSSYRIDEVNKTIPLQRSFGQGSGGVAPTCDDVDCAMPSTSWGPRLSGVPTYDHARDIYTNGSVFDNTLSASGGNERTSFYLSGSATNHEGIVKGPHDTYERYTARLKASHRIGGGLELQGNIAYVDDRGDLIQKGSNTSGVNLGLWRSPPDFNNFEYIDPETGLHRSYRFPNPSSGSQTRSRGYDNPLFVINRQRNTQQVGRSYGNIGVNYDPEEWLSVRFTSGVDYVSDERLETLPQSSSAFPTGQLVRGNIVNYQLDNNLTATLTRAFVEGFESRLTLGGNLSSRNYRQNFVTGQNLIAPEPFNLQNVSDYTTNEFRSLVRGQSFFAQAQQTLYDQLFITGTIRNDGFSTFGASDRRHWFPAATVAWTFTNAYDFGGFLNDGRLRAAYGEVGTEPGVYLTSGFYSSGFFVSQYGDALQATQGGRGGLFTANRRPQNDLTPERQREVEAGIDLGFLNGRADMSLTYYNRRAQDVIFDLPLASSTGYAVQASNAGTIRNRGFEATLNVRPVQTRDIDWDLGFQYSQNRNKVLELQGADAVDLPTGGFFAGTLVSAVEGFPIGVFRSYDFVRCRYGSSENTVDLGSGEPTDVNALCRAAGAPKNALYIAEDGFPIEDPTQRVIGDPNPNWTGSLRTGLRFRKVQLSGLLDIRKGGEVWNGTKGALYNFGTHRDTEIRGQTRTFGKDFRPGGAGPTSFATFGPGAGTPVVIDEAWYTGTGSGFANAAQQFLEDGSFVKLREVSLGYTFDGGWVRNGLGLSSLDLRLAGRNLFTWTDYSGIDPETNLGGAEVAAQGIDYFNNPQTRSFVITIGINR